MRDMVWEEWKKANAAADESRLPATGPLAEAADMSWDIPSELEPDAVMPYVYGCRESRPRLVRSSYFSMAPAQRLRSGRHSSR